MVLVDCATCRDVFRSNKKLEGFVQKVGVVLINLAYGHYRTASLTIMRVWTLRRRINAAQHTCRDKNGRLNAPSLA